MRINKIALLTILIMALFCSGCHKFQQAKTPIKIAFDNWPYYAIGFLAQEKGFFEKNGVNVELKPMVVYQEALNLYRAGGLDGLFMVFADAIFLDTEGTDTKVVYVLDYSETGDVIVGKKEFKSLSEMRGKKFGIESINSFSHLFVETALEKSGLKIPHINFVIVPQRDSIKALDSGKVDAIHVYEPYRSEALNKGYKILFNAGDIPGIITDVVGFRTEVVRDRPKDVLAIVKSLNEAQIFISQNRKEAAEIMARSFKMFKMGEEEMKGGLAAIHMLDLNDNMAAMGKNESDLSLFKTGKKIAEFFSERGQMVDNPDLTDIIDPEFVKQIK